MAKKFLTAIDLAKNELQNAVVQNLASAPGTPTKGQIYFDTTATAYLYYDGATWQTLATAGAAGNVLQTSNSGGAGRLKVSSGSNKTIVDYATAGIVKSDGSGVASAAVAGTDYAVATAGSAILKGNGAGGFANAVSSTDYAPATTGSSSLKGNGSGGFANATLNDNGAPTADFSMNTHKLTNVVDPSAAQDAATKNYVDATSQGLLVKAAARVATVGTETFTVASGSVTVIAGTTLDGISPAIGDRILIKDAPSASGVGSPNSTQPGNGIYTVTNATTNLSVSRVTDLSGTNAPQGAFVFVEAGTVNAAAGYVVSTPSAAGAFTYGTNNIAFTQFSGAGEISAGTGLSKSGNSLSIENSGVLLPTHGGTGVATISGIVKGNGTSNFSVAVAGTDYAAATSGTSILKGNGAGGFSSAKFTATIGDGSTTAIAVTHGLGTKDVICQIRDAATDAVVDCDIVQTSTTVTTFTFAVAPATNAYKVVIIG